MDKRIESFRAMDAAVTETLKGKPNQQIFVQFNSVEEGLTCSTCTIMPDGSVNIATPDMAMECGRRASELVRTVMEKGRGVGNYEFPSPPVMLALEILFGEIARLRLAEQRRGEEAAPTE